MVKCGRVTSMKCGHAGSCYLNVLYMLESVQISIMYLACLDAQVSENWAWAMLWVMEDLNLDS